MGVSLYGRQRKQLEDSPVETLLRTDPAVLAAAEAAAKDPALTGEYLDALASKEKALGVADPKLLTEGQRQGIAADLVWNPALPRKRTETLGQVRAIYGDRYNDIIREVAPKLDGMARVLIHMDPTEASRLDGAYAQADAFKTSAAVQASMKDLRPALDAEFSELAATLSDNPDGMQRYAEHVEAATVYAQSLVFAGASPQAAARTAGDAIVNSQFNYRDTLRIPQRFNDGRIVHALEAEKVELAKSGVFIVQPVQFSSSEQALLDVREHIDRLGYWITNEAGDGAVLRIPHKQGSGEVLREDGSRVEFKFEDMAVKDLSGLSLYVPYEGY
jgi:hypothetical protein